MCKIKPSDDTTAHGEQTVNIGHLIARLNELEQLEHNHRQTLESLYEHQEQLRAQNKELRHAQTSLENARRRHQELFDYAPVAQFLVTPNGMILKTNRVASELLGLEHHDLFNYHMPNLASNNNYRVAILNFVETVTRNQQPRPIQVDLFRKDGKSIQVQLHGSRSSNRETSILLTAVCPNGSNQPAQVQSQRLSDALFQHSKQCLFITDPSWRIQQINPALSHISGYRNPELQNWHLERLIHCQQNTAKQWQVWQTRQIQHDWHGQASIRAKHGQQQSIQLSLHRIDDEHGNAEAYLGLIEPD